MSLEDKVRDIVRILDKDGNGYMSAEEVRSFVAALGGSSDPNVIALDHYEVQQLAGKTLVEMERYILENADEEYINLYHGQMILEEKRRKFEKIANKATMIQLRTILKGLLDSSARSCVTHWHAAASSTGGGPEATLMLQGGALRLMRRVAARLKDGEARFCVACWRSAANLAVRAAFEATHGSALKTCRSRYETMLQRVHRDGESELETLRADYALSQAELTRKDIEIHQLKIELEGLYERVERAEALAAREDDVVALPTVETRSPDRSCLRVETCMSGVYGEFLGVDLI